MQKAKEKEKLNNDIFLLANTFLTHEYVTKSCNQQIEKSNEIVSCFNWRALSDCSCHFFYSLTVNLNRNTKKYIRINREIKEFYILKIRYIEV